MSQIKTCDSHECIQQFNADGTMNVGRKRTQRYTPESNGLEEDISFNYRVIFP